MMMAAMLVVVVVMMMTIGTGITINSLIAGSDTTVNSQIKAFVLVTSTVNTLVNSYDFTVVAILATIIAICAGVVIILPSLLLQLLW